MPASPYPSCREPTRIVRFTVTVDRDWSGTNNARKPLGKAYSVIPSTLTILRGVVDVSAIACVDLPKVSKVRPINISPRNLFPVMIITYYSVRPCVTPCGNPIGRACD